MATLHMQRQTESRAISVVVRCIDILMCRLPRSSRSPHSSFQNLPGDLQIFICLHLSGRAVVTKASGHKRALPTVRYFS